MTNHDLSADAPPSISAAELRRRLLASAPPSATLPGSSPELDLPPSQTSRVSGTISAALGRLTMPSTHGPVAATSLPPVAEAIPELPSLPSRSRYGLPGLPADNDLSAYADAPPSVTMPMARVTTQASITTPSPAAPLAGNANGRPHTEEDYRRLKQENRELRKLLDEMKQLLQEASDHEQVFATREAEMNEKLAAKQRQIDELTNQLQSIEEQVASGMLAPAPAVPKTRTELEEWSDELERESALITNWKKDIENDRKQLRDDEESLERQMRQMEVSMAKERALMARQETELKRLSAEIQHELEIMQRGDASLREQLSKFQRRAADVMQGRVGPQAGQNGSGTTSGGRR